MKAYVSLALRVLVGLVFLVPGILKAHDGIAATVSSVAAYRILPPSLNAPLGIILPFFEIGLGLFLIAGLFTRIAAIVGAIELLVFAGGVASLIVRNIPANCGCLGSGVATPPSWPHVGLDIVLAALSATVARLGAGAFALERALGVESPPESVAGSAP